jgi:hypothetical protein
MNTLAVTTTMASSKEPLGSFGHGMNIISSLFCPFGCRDVTTIRPTCLATTRSKARMLAC